jgi:hypothetical protein
MIPPDVPLQTLQQELNRLKEDQDKAMALAIYVGMTTDGAKASDERRRRIYELYEAIIATATQY